MSAQLISMEQCRRSACAIKTGRHVEGQGVSRSLTMLMRHLARRRRSRDMRRALVGLCALIVCWDLSTRVDKLAGDVSAHAHHYAAIDTRSN